MDEGPGGEITPAAASVPEAPAPRNGPGEGWIRVGGLGLLAVLIAFDAMVPSFEPDVALYVPLILGIVAGNEAWAWVTKASRK